MSELLVALDSVQSQVSHLCSDALKSKSPLLKKTKAIQAFQNAETFVAQQIVAVTKIPSKPRSVKHDLKRLKNLLQSVHNGIEDNELNPKAVREVLRNEIKPVLENLDKSSQSVRHKLRRTHEIDSRIDEETIELQNSIDHHLALAKASPKNSFAQRDAFNTANILTEEVKAKMEALGNQYDTEDTSNSADVLKTYSKYAKAFVQPASPELKLLQQNATCLPVSCPIFVSFVNSHLRELSALNTLGFETTGVSSRGSDHPDIALILEDQILLQFSKSATKKLLIDSYADDRATINARPETKVLRKLKQEAKKLLQELEEVDAALAVKQDSTDRALLKVMNAQRTKLEQSLYGVNTRIEKADSNLKKLRHDIVVSQRETITKSAMKDSNGRKKIMLKSKAFEFHINSVLHKFSEAGKDYSLISNDFIPHPSLPDISIAWLVPSDQARMIRSLYGDSNLVTSWGFPWMVCV